MAAKQRKQGAAKRRAATPVRTAGRKVARKPAGNTQDRAVREHVLYLLREGGAHISFEQAIADFPPELRGIKPSGLPFTAWGVLEHMRIAQWDILEFSRNPKHVSPEFPKGYWPESDAPPDGAAWDRSVKEFQADLRATQRLVKNPSRNLYARIAHGAGQTILREALMVADHNAYHLGQLVLLRRLLGVWKG